ncbi:MAG TPA: glycosyltransferase family 4 protein [Burkholderiaceae bacterium]|nr:glycosyltransferase family 4 protein [Burkholderiaceae bacterium]
MHRVLVVHNAYQQRGGEDSVVEAEVALLRARGHDVDLHSRHNDEIASIGRIALAADTLWSRASARALADHIARFAPDVVHVHNTFPLISPSAYWAAHRARVPVVQTLHNFRLFCPQAMLLRDGRVCEDCVGRLPWPAVRHGCYRGSPAQTAVIAGMQVLHRSIGTWQRRIHRYIALNEFCRSKFIEAGLPAERVAVKPNFVDFPAPPSESPRDGLLFVGRLSPEKGVDTLAQAAARLRRQDAGAATVRVAGSGPESHRLESQPGVALLGSLGGDAVREQMLRARALVMPSIWYENFPRTLVEAFACGLPVIASRIGALAELVDDGRTGLLFEPGNADDLADKMRWVLAHPQRVRRMGDAARAEYEARYTPSRNYEQLIRIYDAAIADHRALHSGAAASA